MGSTGYHLKHRGIGIQEGISLTALEPYGIPRVSFTTQWYGIGDHEGIIVAAPKDIGSRGYHLQIQIQIHFSETKHHTWHHCLRYTYIHAQYIYRN